ncbi:ankyrin repeat domain-containing protein [Endozoicomonas sp. ONNA2]|uniref:ankyrin repeat domain-containing protein n=1 Tax=Endozoicomonas sp. ONNA2 TaxID=2828741 RepID=UPI00214969D4|nr:ankyrin repeat domain-containing protein [Endozoicomonas sp. ONNA2]
MNSLFDAVFCGDHAMVKTLLGRGADPNRKNPRERTALHLAAIKGHHAIVETLLDNGADVDLKDIFGCTPLQFAAGNLHRDVYDTLLLKTHQPDWNRLLHELSETGWKDKVEAALANGANPNNRSSDNHTALGRAALAGHHAIVEILLAHGANPNSQDGHGYTPLERATIAGHHAVVVTLLNNGADPNIPSFHTNETPLYRAADRGHHTIVETLLDYGADPNTNSSMGRTALHRAAIHGHHAIVETLTAKGADPNLKDLDGKTALQHAVTSKSGHLDVFKTLLPKTRQPDWDSLLQEFSRLGWNDQVELALARGANPNNHEVNQDTPLGKAAYARHHATVEILLANGANPNIPGFNGYTPLQYVASRGLDPIVRTLLTKGADPNLRDLSGFTALQDAVKSGHRHVYNILLPVTRQPDWNRLLPIFIGSGWHDDVVMALTKGADPNIPDSYGYTPLHQVAMDGCYLMVKTLLNNGADPNREDRSGKTALQSAADRGYRDITETLIPVTDQQPWNSLLRISSRFGWKDRVEAALANGADPNNPYGSHSATALHLAAAAGHCDIVETLLANGADPKLKDVFGCTVFNHATAETLQAIENFISVPRSLQFYCRASIRSRLVKCLPDNGLPIKEAAGKLLLSQPMTEYVYRPLSL